MRYLTFIFLLTLTLNSNSQGRIVSEEELIQTVRDIKWNRYEIQVNSIGNEIIDSNKTYYLILNDNLSTTNKLLLKEYLLWITKSLELKGYHRILDTLKQKYDYKIFIDCGLSDPIKKNVSLPVLNLPTTSETQVSSNYSGGLNITTTTTNPSLQPTTIEKRYFKRFLNLTCKNYSDDEVWFVNTESEGSSNDLRLIIKVLSFVSSKYVETNTGKIKNLWVDGKLKKELIEHIELVLSGKR
jgi:hypothetical protein